MKFYMLKNADGGSFLASRETVVAHIRKEYMRCIVSWLPADELTEVIRRNSNEHKGTSIDAVHDFCDANVAMMEAFEHVMGREFRDEETSAEGWDEDVSLMNDATYVFGR
jgi:hypothetical protein